MFPLAGGGARAAYQATHTGWNLRRARDQGLLLDDDVSRFIDKAKAERRVNP